jgi:arylsulfatase A-like enzyme
MPPRHAIVIAVDGLRASALGAYGNAWHPTPALDRLASESLLFDWMMVDSPALAGFYRAAWLGAPAPRDGVEPTNLKPLAAAHPAGLLPQLLAAGVAASLTTDDVWLAEQGDQLGVRDVRALEFPDSATAESMADTELAQLFAIAADQLEQWSVAEESAPTDGDPPRLLWLHARGYHGAWDAPLELRQSLLDEDDPEAPTFVTPPPRLETTNLDELLLQRAAYAAQTTILDQCVGMLIDMLAETGLGDSTAVVVIGCRGFALGEHGAAGSEVRELYGEVTHIPCLLRRPDGAPTAPPRASELRQPADLAPYLLEWLGCAHTTSSNDEQQPEAVRDRVVAIGKHGELAMRTQSWLLRQTAKPSEVGEAEPTVELFAKPDDRWEANEIADRCPEEVAELLAEVEALCR